jgi:hypothetical protein
VDNGVVELFWNALLINFTNFSDNPINYFMTPFTDEFGVLTWPIIFAAVIGFTYAATKNVGSVVAMIFLTFGLFGTTNAFLQTPEFTLFFSIIATAGFAGTVAVLFFKKYG